jgi:hypothetical protein
VPPATRPMRTSAVIDKPRIFFIVCAPFSFLIN